MSFNFTLRVCVCFVISLCLALVLCGFISGDLSRSSSNSFV